MAGSSRFMMRSAMKYSMGIAVLAACRTGVLR